MTRKLGPLPVWAWAIIVAIVGYFLYKRFAASGSSGATVPQNASQPATDSTGSTGLTTQAGSPSDTGQSTSDLVSALGGQQASLLAALEQANQDVIGIAQSQISAAQSQGFGSSTSETQPTLSSQPGGSNAPVVDHSSPLIVAPYSSPPPVTSTATRSSAHSSSGAQPYGGVVSTHRTKNGTVITTYASGRVVEQAPGKSAYVARA